MTSATLQRARAAQTKLAAVLAGVAEIRGIGIAVLGAGYGLKVNLSARPAGTAIPAEIDGVPVIVEMVGGIRNLSDPE